LRIANRNFGAIGCAMAFLRAVCRLQFASCIAVLIAGGIRAETTDIPLTFSATVPLYGVQEVSFQLPFKTANPYDPDEIAVDGLFSMPSGRDVRVPAFFFAECDPVTGSPTGKRAWKLRFTPEEKGTHLFKVVVSRWKAPVEEIAVAGFKCTPPTQRGFVRVREGDFVTDGNERYFPFGANRCWGDPRDPYAYFEDMESLAAAGANCIRVWLVPWWLPLEAARGVFDPAASARLDAIMSKAEALGLRVILCLEQHGNFEPEGGEIGRWKSHPYNAENGGPCRTTEEFFTSAEARRLFRNKLRYLVARWGYSTSLLAWELFNEVELVPAEEGRLIEENREAILSWHREMASFLRRCDPFDHLVATSSGTGLQRQLVADGAVDFIQLHLYVHARDELASRVHERLTSLHEKLDSPILVAEFGPVGYKGDDCSITRGIFAARMAGSGALPWLQDLPDPAPAYLRLKAARGFFAGARPWVNDLAPVAGQATLETADANQPDQEEGRSLYVLALAGEGAAILYAHALGATKGTAAFLIPSLTPGNYAVAAWDPARGIVLHRWTAAADANGLALTIPDFPGEIALTIEKR